MLAQTSGGFEEGASTRGRSASVSTSPSAISMRKPPAAIVPV
jgi:hypothetical protein